MTLTWYRHFQRNVGFNQILKRQTSRFHYGSNVPVTIDFHIVKMYKDNEVNKNVKNIVLSMCDVRVFLTFISQNLVLL
jgi:hypothetical protein